MNGTVLQRPILICAVVMSLLSVPAASGIQKGTVDEGLGTITAGQGANAKISNILVRKP